MPSGFDELKSKVDYQIENLIDENSWEKKKIYSSAPFLVTPDSKFHIKLGSLLPYFSCYIRVQGEQFGDSIAFNLSGHTVRIFIYNENNQLVVRDSMEITNNHLGEVTYKWKDFDLQSTGNYVAEIEVKNQEGKTFKLPDTQNRVQIIVS